MDFNIRERCGNGIRADGTASSGMGGTGRTKLCGISTPRIRFSRKEPSGNRSDRNESQSSRGIPVSIFGADVRFSVV